MSGCAARVPALPTGTGEPIADAQALFDTLTAPCRDVRTLTADIALSGRTTAGRLRGRVQVGFRAPDSLRLEGLPPFGAPIFVLAAGVSEPVLLLPRDDRVHTGTPTRALVEAVSGLALDAAAMRAVVAGCVTTETRVTTATRYRGQQDVVRAADGTTLLAREGRIVVGIRDALRIDYVTFVGTFPSQVRITSATGAAPIDATLRIRDIETNRELDDSAFQVAIPAEARPISLDELRRLGPLGEAP